MEHTAHIQRVLSIFESDAVEHRSGLLSSLLALSEDEIAAVELEVAAGKKIVAYDDSEEPDDDDMMSDMDLRHALSDALRPEAGFVGLDAVYGNGTLVYAVSTGEGMKTMRRSFTMKDGKPEMADDGEEVRPVTRFEPVAASAAEPRAASCGCGGSKDVHPPAGEGNNPMTKAERIAALEGKTPFTAEQLDGMNDELIKACEAAVALADETDDVIETPPEAPAPKALSEEDFLKTAPQSIRDLVAREKKRDVQRREFFLKALADSKQEVYSDDELKAMNTESLEKAVRLLAHAKGKGVTPIEVDDVDFAGKGLPRAAAQPTGEEEKAPPVPDWNTALKAASERRKA